MGYTNMEYNLGKHSLVSVAGVNRELRAIAFELLSVMVTLDGTPPFDIVSHLSFIIGKPDFKLTVRQLFDCMLSC
jgi:hypothetical protein